MNLIEPKSEKKQWPDVRRGQLFACSARDYDEGASRISPLGGFSVHRKFRGSWIDVPPIRDGGKDKKRRG